jgi:endonuclease VIII
MPEGDTIHRAARTLGKALAGKQVTRFESVFPKLNRIDEDDPIAGRMVRAVESRGKHLLIHLSGGIALRTHMAMSGSWHIYRAGESWQRPAAQMRIAIQTADFQAIAFEVHDAEWLGERDLERGVLARLGPDVLAPDFDPAAAVARLRASGDRAILDALLDQRVLSGLGNVYKSELLFLARAHPLRPVASLSDDTLLQLARLAQQHLRANASERASAGIVTYRGLRRTTGRSDPAERLWVYSRGGMPCRRCGTPIASARMGVHARITYLCPTCQPRDERV